MDKRDFNRDAKDISRTYGNKGYSPEQIANISQLLGRKGARDFFRSGKNDDIVGTLYANGGDLTDPKKKAAQQKKKDSLYVFTHNPKEKKLGMDQGAYEKYMSMAEKYFNAEQKAKDDGEADINDYLTLTRDEAKIIEEYADEFGGRYNFNPKGKTLAEKANLFSGTAINVQTSPYLVNDRDYTFKDEFKRGEKALSQYYDVKAFHNKDSTDFKKSLKSIPKNSKVMFMDHTGDKMFGLDNSRFGELLADQEVDTCIGGTCFGEGVANDMKKSAPNTKFITSKAGSKWEGFNVKGKDTLSTIFPKGSVEFATGGNLNLGLTDPPTKKKPNIDIEKARHQALNWRVNPENVDRLKSNLSELGKDPNTAGDLTIKSLLNIRKADVKFSGLPKQAGVSAETHGTNVDLHEGSDDLTVAHELEHTGGIDKPLSELIRKRYGSPLQGKRRMFAESEGFSYDPQTYKYTSSEGKQISGPDFDKKMFDAQGSSAFGRESLMKHMRYLNSNGELYPRVQEIRRSLNIQPGQHVDEQLIQAAKENNDTNELFKYYTDEQVQEMLNTLASTNNRNKRFENIAALGGFIQTI